MPIDLKKLQIIYIYFPVKEGLSSIDLKKLQIICIYLSVKEGLSWNMMFLWKTQIILMCSFAWFYLIQCLLSSSFIDHDCLPYISFLIQFHQTLTKLFPFTLQPRYLLLLISKLTTGVHSLTLPTYTQNIPLLKG